MLYFIATLSADVGIRQNKEEGVKTLQQVVTNSIIDVDDINAKLNELTEQNKAAIEELRTQSSKIIEKAKTESNMVIERAKANFRVHMKSSEIENNVDEDSAPKEPATIEPTQLEPTPSRTEHIMAYLN